MIGCLESDPSVTSFTLEPMYSCNAGDSASNLRLLINESATLEREIYSDAASPRKVNEKRPNQLTNSIGIKQLATKRNKLTVMEFAGHPLDVMTQASHTRGIIDILADSRRKRSVWHLYNMILCTTGCDPLLYKGYGCYCGFLGSSYAVDGIDSCCKMHDRCYIAAKCPTFLEYFIPYKWICYFHQPLCGFSHKSGQREDLCAQKLCECDRELALCLRRFPCPQRKALCTSSPWRLLQNVLTS